MARRVAHIAKLLEKIAWREEVNARLVESRCAECGELDTAEFHSLDHGGLPNIFAVSVPKVLSAIARSSGVKKLS